MRKGILDVKAFENDEKTLMLGMLSALIGSAAWLLIATFFRLPVSTTHSIVGATVGFGLVAHGVEGLNVNQLSKSIIKSQKFTNNSSIYSSNCHLMGCITLTEWHDCGHYLHVNQPRHHSTFESTSSWTDWTSHHLWIDGVCECAECGVWRLKM